MERISTNMYVHLHVLVAEAGGSTGAEAVKPICGIEKRFIVEVAPGSERRLRVCLLEKGREGFQAEVTAWANSRRRRRQSQLEECKVRDTERENTKAVRPVK